MDSRCGNQEPLTVSIQSGVGEKNYMSSVKFQDGTTDWITLLEEDVRFQAIIAGIAQLDCDQLRTPFHQIAITTHHTPVDRRHRKIRVCQYSASGVTVGECTLLL